MPCCALAEWNIAIFWTLITHELDRISVRRAYGTWHVEPRLLVRLPTSQLEIEFLFCWMDQAMLIPKHHHVRRRSPGVVISRDTHMTKSSPVMH
jgi:hypothetical protein